MGLAGEGCLAGVRHRACAQGQAGNAVIFPISSCHIYKYVYIHEQGNNNVQLRLFSSFLLFKEKCFMCVFIISNNCVCVHACECVCVRACVRTCVRAWARMGLLS